MEFSEFVQKLDVLAVGELESYKEALLDAAISPFGNRRIARELFAVLTAIERRRSAVGAAS